MLYGTSVIDKRVGRAGGDARRASNDVTAAGAFCVLRASRVVEADTRWQLDEVLGHTSVGRSTETPRSLRLCEAEGGGLVHSLDAPCGGWLYGIAHSGGGP